MWLVHRIAHIGTFFLRSDVWYVGKYRAPHVKGLKTNGAPLVATKNVEGTVPLLSRKMFKNKNCDPTQGCT